MTTWPTTARTFGLAAVFALGPATPILPGPSTYRADCDAIAVMEWSGFTIDEAVERPANDSAPAHCRVRGTIDEEIHFELLLPLEADWNGRFVMGGGGGFVGSVQNQAMELAGRASPLARGFATVGTDTGHQGNAIDASWALDRDDREVNFGSRAVHVTAEAAKTIIRIHYARDIAFSYFLGCSRGGGQAMMSSQRYPDDFDGIVGGAPAYDWTGIGLGFIQNQQALYPDPANLSEPVVTAEVRELLQSAILDTCDAKDGIEDGILNDPRACDFRPADLPRCVEGRAGPGCATDAQVAAIEQIYGGAWADGERVYPGFPFGGEADPQGWALWITGPAGIAPGIPDLHYAFGTQMFKYLVFDDPSFDYSTYDASDFRAETRHAASVLNATDPDLTAFRTAGGKLILWTGWSDPALTAYGTIDYYEAVLRENDDAPSFARLFLMPGVLHCSGGPGPDRVEWLDAIVDWVEHGNAPERVPATKRSPGGEVELRRPLCAFPAVAEYDGTGDPAREESFECTTPGG